MQDPRVNLRSTLLRKLALMLLICGLQSGCGSLFFYPQRELISSPADFGLSYHDVSIVTEDDVRLHAWYLPAQGERLGTVLHFHGNAENVSTHIFSVYWLPQAGYDVLTFDYRGFGLSEGTASLPEVINDGTAALRYAKSLTSMHAPCLFIVGQSIGGAIALLALDAESTDPLAPRRTAAGVVLDSTIASFEGIVREKVSSTWLFWPMRILVPLLVPELPDPEAIIAQLRGVPILIIHGELDPIVPFAHALRLYEAAAAPKELWEVPQGGHIDALARPGVRDELLYFFQKSCSTGLHLVSQRN